jgi:site-specific DNA-methyltransferase (adenine-specific)
MKTHHTIIHGDAGRMKQLDKGSIHLVVTSPPYWQLKDYPQTQLSHEERQYF